MNVLMISGILTPEEFMWNEFREACRRHIPGARFCVATEPNCHLWEIRRFRRFIEETTSLYDTGEDLIMIGHSLGGVMACAIQPRLKRTRVLGITTIHSPHRFFFGICTYVLDATRVSAPIISFQGMHDGLVWWGTKHPRSLLHVRNYANHFNDLWQFEENADLIVETTASMFLRRRS